MQDVIDYARRNNIARVRLLQDAFNTASISLYASLGFDVKHAVAEIHLNAAVKAERRWQMLCSSSITAICSNGQLAASNVAAVSPAGSVMARIGRPARRYS